MTQHGKESQSTGLPLVAPLLSEPRRTTSPSSPAAPRRSLWKVGLITPTEPKSERILDFDVETLAAGFAEPEWVPQKITCVAWSWIGSDVVESRVCGPLGFMSPQSNALRVEMLQPLLDEIAKADMLTGHNIMRFDLPVINAECMRLGLEPIREVKVQDTMKLTRSKGFKKGQDNLETLFKTRQQKLSLNWQEWQDAYDEPEWKTIRDRAETDVIGHKEVRQKLIDLGYMKKPVVWRG
jgi:DNA polymerase elongation subunit (family B)